MTRSCAPGMHRQDSSGYQRISALGSEPLPPRPRNGSLISALVGGEDQQGQARQPGPAGEMPPTRLRHKISRVGEDAVLEQPPSGGSRHAGSAGRPESQRQRERFWPYLVALRYFFFRLLRSEGNPSTDPIRSAIASTTAVRRFREGARVSRSRTTSDFETLRSRDSASI